MKAKLTFIKLPNEPAIDKHLKQNEILLFNSLEGIQYRWFKQSLVPSVSVIPGRHLIYKED